MSTFSTGCSLNFWILLMIGSVFFCEGYPIQNNDPFMEPSQFELKRTKDGGYQATFSMSNGFDLLGTKGNIAASQVYNMGPQGSSSSGGHSVNILSDTPGLNFDYSQASSQAQAESLYGTAAANGEAYRTDIKTPWTSTSNGKANTFATVHNYDHPQQNNYPWEVYRKRAIQDQYYHTTNEN